MTQQSGDTGGQDFAKNLRDMEQRLERLEQIITSLASKRTVQPPPIPHSPPKARPTGVETPKISYPLNETKPKEYPVSEVSTFAPPAIETVEVTRDRYGVKKPEQITEKFSLGHGAEINLEKQIGQKWFLVAGIAVLLLGGAFFFKLAYVRGWIVPTPPMRCLIGLIAGLVVIAIGEVTLRRGLRFFAGGMFGLSVVWLYLTAWAASPNGLFPEYYIIGENVAFFAMIAVTILGVVLGLRAGMIFCAIVALVGAFATPILLTSGLNHQLNLMMYLLAVDIGFLGLGLLKKWFPLGVIALGGTVILVAGWAAAFLGDSVSSLPVTGTFSWLYFAAFAGYAVLSTKLAKPNPIYADILIGLPAILMTILWITADFSNPVLLTFALVLQAALLGTSLWGTKRNILSLFGVVTTTLGFAVACSRLEDNSQPYTLIIILGWVSIALFFAHAVYGQLAKRVSEYFTTACIIAPGLLIVLMWSAALRISTSEILPYLCALNVIVLSICFILKLGWTKLAALGWTALGIILTMTTTWVVAQEFLTVRLEILYSIWIWIYFVIFTFDILLRTFRKVSRSNLHLDTVMSFLLTGGMFASTYFLGKEFIGQWMGCYTAGLTAAAAIVSLILWRRGFVALANVYFIQGLTLLMFAVPIQFDNIMTTCVWAGLGLAMILLAKKWNNVLLLAMPIIAVGAAVIHFLGYELQYDPIMFKMCFEIAGVKITNALVLAGGLGLGMVAIATIMLVGKPVKNRNLENSLGLGFAAAAALLFCVRCILELPPTPATWCILVSALIILVLGLMVRQCGLLEFVAAMLLVGGIKWMFHDLLACKIDHGVDLESIPILNWSLMGGAAIAILMGSLNTLGKWRETLIHQAIPAVLGLSAWFVILWGGSFEIDRFVLANKAGLADSGKALQMGLSLWWAVCATAMLVWGFIRSFPSLRYFAIGVFFLTLGKVFILDMRGVDAAYRILSFLGLGMLLVAASWLYNRHFKTPIPQTEPESQQQRETE